MSTSVFRIRPTLPSDEPFLRRALYVALWDAPDEPRRPATVLEDPRIASLVANWGRAGDVGFIAELSDTHQPLGAVWIRTYIPPPLGEDLLDAQTPHLGIAVLDDYQGQGVGTALMRLALEEARQTYLGVALSVHGRNPARAWYGRLGFREVGVGRGRYVVMLYEFDRATEFRIGHLFEHPDCVDLVARWIYNEFWADKTVHTPESLAELLRDADSTTKIPLSLLAWSEGAPVGTVNLIENDDDQRTYLRPWLAALFVELRYRNRGIGSALVRKLAELSARLGNDTLYLGTDNPGFYRRLGAVVQEQVNEDFAVMRLELCAVRAKLPQ